MYRYRGSWSRSIAAGMLAASMFCSGAASASTTDDSRILEKLSVLEARISALETENRAIKKEAVEAQAQLRKVNDQRFRSSNAVVPTQPGSALAYKVYPVTPKTSGWTGMFWGASAGGVDTRSSVTSTQRDTLIPSVNIPGAGYDAVGRSAGNHAGGVIDVFAGWNTQINRIVIGGQLEATAANLNFSSNGAKVFSYFDANGPSGHPSSGDFRPQVAARWMSSALLRAGVLLDDQTLAYAIGGWTVAQFEARNVTDNTFYQPVESFWANGWTGGAGIERKLDSNWSVRAEYRYTSFGNARTTDHFGHQFAQTQYDQSMQTGRVGFAYSINPLQ